MSDPTRRFTDRVGDYVAARPGYPPEVLRILEVEAGFSSADRVVDLGSGTGIFTAMLLDHGNEVHAVEPNAAMRAAAERALGQRPGFRSVDGRAEATGLPDHVFDWAFAAQAMHWFDPDATRRELRRILRPGGRLAAVWNHRRTAGTPFLVAWEALLLRWCPEYPAVAATWSAPIDPMFATMTRRAVAHVQWLDRAGVHARLLSSSYVPKPGEPNHAPLMAAFDAAFDAESRDGLVAVTYDCEVTFGPLASDGP